MLRRPPTLIEGFNDKGVADSFSEHVQAVAVFSIGVRNIRAMSEVTMGSTDPVLAKFDRACPNATHSRDIFAHPEDYARNVGKHQKNKIAGPPNCGFSYSGSEVL